MNRIVPSVDREFFALAASLFIPSTATIQKFLGIEGVITYLFVASLALWLEHYYLIPNILSRLTDRQVLSFLILTLSILLVLFLTVYPIVDSGIVGGGSDSEDALNLATRELLSGKYPYYPKTYLGNPITPLPGALVLAIPFVLIGNSAYQNLFWLAAFVLTMAWYFKSAREALISFWTILILSPLFLHQVAVGSDYVSNSLYVLLFLFWLIDSVSSPSALWKRFISSVLLGISLSSRPNFVLILPVVFSALVQRVGWKLGIRYTAIISIVLCAITAPFLLYDPQSFSPLHVTSKLSRFNSVLPSATFVITSLMAILSILLSFQRLDDIASVLRSCAVIQAVPVLLGIFLSTLQSGQLDFRFASFGTFFLFFGAVSSWGNLSERTQL